LDDARDRSLPADVREDACRFLAGGPALDFWASLARLDADRVRALGAAAAGSGVASGWL
jgi:hypothetical protein